MRSILRTSSAPGKPFFSQSIPEDIQVNAARGRNKNCRICRNEDQACVINTGFFYALTLAEYFGDIAALPLRIAALQTSPRIQCRWIRMELIDKWTIVVISDDLHAVSRFFQGLMSSSFCLPSVQQGNRRLKECPTDVESGQFLSNGRAEAGGLTLDHSL